MERKIVISMFGRLGNQMFQYTFSKIIQQEFTGKIIIDFSRQEATAKALEKVDKKSQGWSDQLKYFKTKYEVLEVGNTKKITRLLSRIKYLNLIQKLFYILHFIIWKNILSKYLRAGYDELPKVLRLYSDVLSMCGLYIFPVLTGPKLKKNYFQNFLLEAGFEESKIYEQVLPEVKKEFISTDFLRKVNNDFYESICTQNSVCVTIRRGDYLSKEAFSSFFQTGEDYFRSGIRLAKKRIENPVFFFFSDDLEYAKEFAQSLKMSNESYFVEREDNSVSEKLLLMSSCKHFIISNSTFSWWCQFLCENADKIVIAPEYWYPNVNRHMPIEQKQWIRIEKSIMEHQK